MPRMSIKGQGHILKRLMKIVFENYLWQFIAVIVCIVVTAYATIQSSTFTRDLVDVYIAGIQKGTKTMSDLANAMIPLGCVLALGVAASYIRQRLMVSVGQGTMLKIRTDLFTHMESLPIRYFDTHSHGDIMSIYTNDVDTLRQLISQSIPEVINSAISVVMVFFAMLNNSWIMTILSLILLTFQMLASAKLAKLSGKHFVAQQANLGRVNGFIEEMMTGQKVVKVFCHEEESEADFDRINEELFRESEKANKYANTLGPILNNIGNVLYVIVAVAGGLLLIGGVPNVSVSGLAFSISIVVPFLNMTKSFAGNIGQVSHQVNAVVMGIAGTKRIFALLDEAPEGDEGYVTLVNAKEVNGEYVECAERTGLWAWKHPHRADGTVTYVPLRGDVRLFDVDFEYEPGKPVLHDISLYAKPGQKVAFVGATGAGKTTITNLLNRFYDIADGKIRYEIDNRRREVTIDDVDTSSRNLLSNPAHAFDFIGTQYAPSLVSDAEGRAVVRLTPTSADASPAGEILVTVDTAAMRPESLRYDYDGEQVGIAVLGVAPLDTPLKAFSKGDYKGYEFIDFR